jgi:hypothetical protein
MIGKVHQDSFQGLRIRIDADLNNSVNGIEFDPIQGSGFSSPVGSIGDSLGMGPRDCQSDRLSSRICSPGFQTSSVSQLSPDSSSTCSLLASSPTNSNNSQTASSRYKTEMCRPFQENGVCKYGEKCQFAHGQQELRTVNRHPKYKTDMCRTYHSVGFCPYGPRCHFIHSLEELRAQQNTPEKKAGPAGTNAAIKQLPMFGGSNSPTSNQWNFPDNFSSDMKSAVQQLNKYFNTGSDNNGGLVAASRTGFNSSGGSSDSSRSGSFCSDNDSLSSPASSPPYSPDKASRLPIFSRLA